MKAFAESCSGEGGWAADDVVGQYALKALRLHMSEALFPDPLSDTEAQGWLDVSDLVLSHPFVRAAAEAFGCANLECYCDSHIFLGGIRQSNLKKCPE